jgi:uncharacterized membrane protein (DUF441 family)
MCGGVASIVAGILAPLVSGAAGGLTHFGAWSSTEAIFIGLAQLTLGRL